VRKVIRNVEHYINFTDGLGNDGKPSLAMDSLKRLAGGAFSLHYVLLLAAAPLPKPLFDHFVTQLESFLFYYIFTKTPTKDLEKNFSTWADEMRGIAALGDAAAQKAKINAFVAEHFQKNMDGKAQELSDALKRFSLYSMQQYRTRYLLARLAQHVDLAFSGVKVPGSLEPYTTLEIEHILPDHAALADMSIIRGFDYYTGSVYEAKFLDIPEFTRSIGGGGRYADLAGQYINKNLPGVGISIGLTSIFEVLYHHNRIKPGRKCPTDVLVVLPSEERRADAAQTAQILRTPNAARPNGLNVELFHKPAKTGDQITYASKKGIPYVWFPPFQKGDTHRVKNLESGDQIDNVQPDRWIPVS
jgi:histidyl-tRNA synthetase